MSDEKKLSDDLEDMLGDAKEGVKKAAEKAEDFAKEAKEKATGFAGEAKEKASEFAEDAKEFAQDAKETLSEGGGKGIAIISHLWWIGWIIALIMNNSNKTELGSFYIRQTLGIFLLSLLSFIPIIGWVIGLVTVVLWVLSFIGAIGGNQKLLPVLGDKFQEWFKSL